MNSQNASPQLQDLQKIAHAMDKQFAGPFGWRFGWDGVLGLVPVVGDVVTNCVSVYVIMRAAALGAPASVLSRMGMNLLIENVIDIIPFAGNLFDFVWKANTKNMALLEAYVAHPQRVSTRSSWWVGLTLAGLVALVLASIALAVYALIEIIGWLGQSSGPII